MVYRLESLLKGSDLVLFFGFMTVLWDGKRVDHYGTSPAAV